MGVPPMAVRGAAMPESPRKRDAPHVPPGAVAPPRRKCSAVGTWLFRLFRLLAHLTLGPHMPAYCKQVLRPTSDVRAQAHSQHSLSLTLTVHDLACTTVTSQHVHNDRSTAQHARNEMKATHIVRAA